MNKDDSVTDSSGSSYISHGSYQYTIDIQILHLYSLSGLQMYHDRAYYYDGKTKIVLFHLSVIKRIAILQLILYNMKISWTQHRNLFVLLIINGGAIVKIIYFSQEKFFEIRVSYMLHIYIIQKLTELIHPPVTVIIVVAVFFIVIN
jgi:hypothetical protein